MVDNRADYTPVFSTKITPHSGDIHQSYKLARIGRLLARAVTLICDELVSVMTTSLYTLASSSGKLIIATAINTITPVLAQTSGTAQLKQGFQLALGIIFMFGFLWGIIKIWAGANAIAKGDPDGKAGIIAGIIIAGAAAIMGALFSVFGLNGGVLTPQF